MCADDHTAEGSTTRGRVRMGQPEITFGLRIQARDQASRQGSTAKPDSTKNGQRHSRLYIVLTARH